ncbi:methyltransferase, partial [Micromonospora chalcea]
PHLSASDLRMLVLVGGRERGLPEFAALAAAAGLSPRRTYHGADGLTLMEFAAGA